LEGLEITELMLSAIRVDNDKLRIDSGYFAKQMLAADQKIRSYGLGHDELGSLFSRFVKGIFDINAASYVDEGVPFIRIQNLKNGMIDDRGMAFIPEERHNNESKTELLYGDIVLSKTAYPAASMFTLERGNASQDTIATKLSPYAQSNFKAAAIVAYLNSNFGQSLLWRQFQGNVQLHLSLEDGRKVPIPRFTEKLQSAVEDIYSSAEKLRYTAANSINLADKTLLSTLGLDNWTPPTPLSYVRYSSDAFLAGRLDAQFFAPRVSELMKRLGQDGLTIGDIAPARHERFKPGDSGSFNYIEIGGLGSDGTAVAETLPQKEAPSRATQFVRSGDIITSTVRPIRRLSALIAEEQDGDVCSSGFVVLTPQKISSEVLLTYLRLPLFCELMDLHTSATMYPAISEADLLSLPIPAIDTKTQLAIQQSVQEAAASRQRASSLLETAKRAVEIAIEDNEAAALAYLQGVV